MMFRVKNWREFQHYKDRNPPWIKLHFAILSSADWVCLGDSERVLAVACMLIASKNEGQIDGSEAGLSYLQRVAYLNKKPNLKPLIDCGFLESASGCEQMLADARPEKRREETESLSEKETEKVAQKPALPAWVPEGAWKAWLEVRAKKKVPNTDRALQLAVSELTKLREQGHDPSAVLENATLKGWRGLFPLTVATTQPQAAGARPSIVCVTCNQRAFTWTGDRCDPCWRKSQGLAA